MSDTVAWDYNSVVNRILSRVPDTVDRREGSVIFDAVAPCAREIVDLHAEIMTALDNTFAGTANREWLIKRCAEIGVVPFDATYARRIARLLPATLEVAVGERFSYDNKLIFTVSDKTDTDGEYYVQCETAGEIGNNGSGILVPIQYIPGLESATLLPDVVIYGEEEESTEDLRQRYFDTLPTMTLDGNIAQYSKWCREYTGIGNYKIFPEWNGKNTVKVSILSSENTKASDELITAFQKNLDPADTTINDDLEAEDYPQGRGLGMGQAPIGAIVTVTTAKEIAINISCTVVPKPGFDKVVGLEEELAEYLNTINYVRDLVSYVGITAVIQNNYTVDQVLNVDVNGAKDNVQLSDEEICALGTVQIEVAV